LRRRNDAVFAFLEDVLEEVVALFPSRYVHIGGDECPKKRWDACPKCRARIREEGLKTRTNFNRGSCVAWSVG
jgi:hexosaminidase